MSLSEIQITCIILMGLTTLVLLCILPIYTKIGRIQEVSRKLLGAGTFLVMVHFVIQYLLHKHIKDVAEIRTMVNLCMGIPITSLFDLSYLYLQREGKIKKHEWLWCPIFMTISVGLMVFGIFNESSTRPFDYVTYLMALVYAATLYFYAFKILTEHSHILHLIKYENNLTFRPLIRWTQWSMLVVVIIGFGFPLMTFNINPLMRSLYGFIAICSAFIYIFSFMAYSFSYDTRTMFMANLVQERNGALYDSNGNLEEKPVLSEEKLGRMEIIVRQFIESGYYQRPSLTIKDVAVEMGISCNLLKMWLRTTPYEKFNTWLMALRIEKSKELLLNRPEINNEEIAEMCGFCDRQYFQHQFTKVVGISPSKWVKEHRLTD